MSGFLSATLASILAIVLSGSTAATSVASRAVSVASHSTQAVSESFATDWSRPHKISDVPMNAMASAVDSKGHVHVVGSDSYAHSPLYYLTNASGRWVQSEVIRAPGKGAFDRVGIAVDVDDSVWIVFTRHQWKSCNGGFPIMASAEQLARCSSRPLRENTYLINNKSGGWSEPRELSGGVTRIRWTFAVHDGRVQFAYDRYIGHGEFTIWYGTDASGTWSAHKIGPGWGPFLAVGANGDPWIAYTPRRYAGGVVVAHAKGPTSPFNISRAPDTGGEIETAVVEGLDLDSAGRPVALFDRYEASQGYWTYWVRLNGDGWTAPHRLLLNGGAGHLHVDANDRMHFLYEVICDSDRVDGWYYGTSVGRVAQTLRIARGDGCWSDTSSGEGLLLVDNGGRSRVVFAVINEEERLGVWYTVGPIRD